MIYTATRSITPTNGLFTIYLGDGPDPQLSALELTQAAFIGVQVGGDPEMLPLQPLNSVVGHSSAVAGVAGSSQSGIGVVGTSITGVALYGQTTAGDAVYATSYSGTAVFATSVSGVGVDSQSTSVAGVVGHSTFGDGVQGTSSQGNGVYGFTPDVNHAGVYAEGAGPSGIALQIQDGGIKVLGAQIISKTNTTPVFTVQVVTGTVGNNVTPSSCGGNCVVIDNPLTNGHKDAIVIVTPNFSPAGVASGIYTDHPVSV